MFQGLGVEEVGVQGSGGGGAQGQPPAVGEDPAAGVVAVDGDVVVVDVGVVVVAEQDAAVGGVGAGATGPAAGVGVVAFALAGGCVAAGVHASAVVGVQRPPPGAGEGALGASDVEDLAGGRIGRGERRLAYHPASLRSASRQARHGCAGRSPRPVLRRRPSRSSRSRVA